MFSIILNYVASFHAIIIYNYRQLVALYNVPYVYGIKSQYSAMHFIDNTSSIANTTVLVIEVSLFQSVCISGEYMYMHIRVCMYMYVYMYIHACTCTCNTLANCDRL